jgi:Domain of unknown function (DUF1906)
VSLPLGRAAIEPVLAVLLLSVLVPRKSASQLKVGVREPKGMSVKRFARGVIPVVVSVVVLISGFFFATAIPKGGATPPGGYGSIRYGQSQRKGFDTCEAPTVSQMNAWWPAPSNLWDVGIYIGGDNRSCPQQHLTPSWVTSVHNDAYWSFYLFYVGLQAPCTTYRYRMSSDPATANNQGRSVADNAVYAATNLGFTGHNVYYFDMEPYDVNNASCKAAVNAFVSGWSARLDGYWSEKAGVYGNCTQDSVDSWWYGYKPDQVFVAQWNNSPSVWAVCLPSDHWVGGHRLHQYRGGHTEAHGGVTLTVDSDCAYGLVTPHGHYTSGDPDCGG